MAIAPVVIEFLAKGIPEISRAFTTIQQAAVRAERGGTDVAEKMSRARVRISGTEARERVKTAAQTAREEERQKLAEQKAFEKAEKAKTKAAQAASRELARMKREEQRDFERAEQAKTRAAERAAKEQVRIWQKADREEARSRRDAQRETDAQRRQQERDAARWLNRREADQRSAYNRQRQIVGTIVGAGAQGFKAGVGRTTGVLSSVANTALSLGGGFSFADSVQRESALRGEAAQIIAGTAQNQRGGITSASVLSAARATANRFGMSTDDALGAITAFKDKTGNLGNAVSVLPRVAELATATGADVKELSTFVGQVSAGNSKMSMDDVMKVAGVAAVQGQLGAVELKDMAKYGGRLVAGASLIGGDRAANISAMGAMAQVAMQSGGAASPAEAALASQRFMTDVQKKAPELAAGGINVSDGNGKLEAPLKIIEQMLTKSGGDVVKLGQVSHLGERGVRVLTGFADTYREAGGGEKGLEAVRKQFGSFAGAEVNDSAIKKAAADRVGEADKQFTIALNELKDAVGTQLLPEFTKLIPTIREMVPMMGDLARTALPPLIEALKSIAGVANAHKDLIAWFASHPIGVMIGGEITKSLATAGIGVGVRAALERILLGSGPGAGNGAINSIKSVAGAGGIAGLGAGLALGTAAAATTVDQLANVGNAREHGRDYAADVAAQVRAGKISPEQAQKMVKDAKAFTSDGANAMNAQTAAFLSPLDSVSKAVGGSGFGAQETMNRYREQKELANSEDLKQAIVDAIKQGTKEAARSQPMAQRGGAQ